MPKIFIMDVDLVQRVFTSRAERRQAEETLDGFFTGDRDKVIESVRDRWKSVVDGRGDDV